MYSLQVLVILVGGLSALVVANDFLIPVSELKSCKVSKNLRGGSLLKNDLEHSLLKDDELWHSVVYITDVKDLTFGLRTSDGNYWFDIVNNGSGITFALRRGYSFDPEIITEYPSGFDLPEGKALPVELIQDKGKAVSMYVPGYKDGPILSYNETLEAEKVSIYSAYNIDCYYDCPSKPQTSLNVAASE